MRKIEIPATLRDSEFYAHCDEIQVHLAGPDTYYVQGIRQDAKAPLGFRALNFGPADLAAEEALDLAARLAAVYDCPITRNEAQYALV